MIQRPPGVGKFEFVILSTLRAAQLIRGCTPKVDGGHKPIITAQFEVAGGLVSQFFPAPARVGEPAPPAVLPVENPPT